MPALTLAAVDGSDTLNLTDPASPVYLMAGAKGLDLPIPAVAADISPFLDGELVRNVRDTARDVFLPLLLTGDTIGDLWAARSRLFALLRPTDRAAGCRLTATDPATGAGRYVDVVYAGGAEGDYGKDQYGRVWQKYGIVARAADPAWYDTADQAVSWSGSTTTVWFPIFPLNLSPSQILSGATVAGTTNLIENPSAELTLNSWATLGAAADPALTRDTSRALYGTTSVRYDWPTSGTGGEGGYTILGMTVAVTYTVTVWVWVPTGAPAVQLGVFFLTSGTTSTVHDSWQRLTVTFAATGASHYVFVGATTATVLGQQVWVDGWQCEAAAAGTAYCDGDQPGCHWTGTPHASPSVRDATYDGVTLDVAGDTRTWPVWTVAGPGTSLTLVHHGQGRRLDLVGDIPAGAAVTVDTRPRRQAVYDSAGNNLMGRLTAGFYFFPLDPGRNDVSIALAGTTASSAVTVSYTPRWSAA